MEGIFPQDGRNTLDTRTLLRALNYVTTLLRSLDNLILLLVQVLTYSSDISMLKRSHSMDLATNDFKPPMVDQEQADIESKKMCSSPAEDGKSSEEASEESVDSRGVRKARRYNDNAHVTQSRSIFSHENSFVYGNPKELIKTSEVSEAPPEVTPYDTTSSNVLDLSCKPSRTDQEKPLPEANTYQNYNTNHFPDPSFPRSNLEIKLVNPQTKKHSITEQLQIAKVQQQQRRSIQQQQKMLQQMRRSLEPVAKDRSRSHHHSNNVESPQSVHKNMKYYGNSHEGVEGSHYPPPQYPYYDPGHPKELPDGHPILPLLDPVYFSALYNAHGFMPPSSPSIAAAFIGTLQDALPKLPMMFPSTSTNNNPLLPQKSNDNPN